MNSGRSAISTGGNQVDGLPPAPIYSAAPRLLDELQIRLSDLNENLHASSYLYEGVLIPSGVSVHMFYAENDPQESIFFLAEMMKNES